MRLLLAILTALAFGSVHAAESTPDSSIFGRHNFIEYVPGDLPLIISVPHGGRLKPAEIPDRTSGVVDIDANTHELARAIASVIHAETGRHTHLIICRLHRSKLDANRELAEAAQDSPLAQQAWTEHHDFIAQACDAAVKQFGVAFLIDLHGHGHADARVELGYRHDSLDLADCDEALNQPTYINAGSLRWIAQRSSLSYSELLRGPQSFGALLETAGFPATPSPRMPVPTQPFFRGGYTIQRHCSAERNVTGLQIEANRPRLRDTEENRLLFSRALVQVLRTYFPMHLGIRLDEPKPVLEAQ
ncbi:hypothetical protein [Prosthecobacter sp.]|uniref:hypothetical protein n=1 Tax=Prosthecobacter sp. TaxID=1965333 RepID=UPI0037847021